MKTKIVKLSELGTNCWTINRFIGTCLQCSRVACKERTISPEIQNTLDEMEKIRKAKRELNKKLKELEGKL